MDLKQQLGAEGRVVLTSSSATQKSFEQEGSILSLYTQYLVEGIETGAADKDNSGSIFIHELHDYAKAKVQAAKPNMTPSIILDREGFNIIIANAPKSSEAEYRKLVEKYAQNGVLSEFAYLVLKPKRKTFGITDETAEQIETEVLEPFRRRVANIELYKQAFAKAVEQKYPLDEHIVKILKDYQQDILGLRDEDVVPIELEITSVKEIEYQKHIEQIQKQEEQAKKEFVDAFLKEVEESEKLQQQNELASDRGVDYGRLRDFLKAGQWKEADEETLKLMLKVVGREQEGWLDTGSSDKFPCTDLRTIDKLWVKYSNGRFGFSVQKKNLARSWEKMGCFLRSCGMAGIHTMVFWGMGKRKKYKIQLNIS
ncbi:GUN4 domain-containing protein [Nostoc piscinale]|uniref:GUN4 domain-containing protein n=1 Tax=Nostoc piscinale TaxID=224012 RepID=UPI000A47EC0C